MFTGSPPRFGCDGVAETNGMRHVVALTEAGVLYSCFPLQLNSNGRWCSCMKLSWMASVATAGVALFAAGFGWVTLRNSTARQPMETLTSAVSAESRFITPRLSARIPWAPLRRVASLSGSTSSANRSDIRLRAATAEVIKKASTDISIAAKHAEGLARLLNGDVHRAVSTLSAVAADANDAAIWSDLAGAHFEVAATQNAPEHLERALAASDEALALDRDSAAGAFNRALILQELGLRDLSRAAWQRFLEIDNSSGWAAEARERVRDLAPSPDFRPQLDHVYAAIGRGDRESARELAARYPQECRTWGETEILGRWGDSTLQHDVRAAASHLAVARALGSALASGRGENLLAAAVATIDEADDVRRRSLAGAHSTYRKGRMIYARERPAEAEPLLRKAATVFRAGGSPMTFAARYYAANTAFDQNRIEDAHEQLSRIQRELPPQYEAVWAQTDWQLGLCEFAKAQWSRSLLLLHASVTHFERLGEQDNASFVRGIMADAYENLGELSLARRDRVLSLARLGRTTDLRLQVALAGMTRTAIRERDWRVATSLLNLETASAEAVGNRSIHVDSLLRRALVHLRQNKIDAARLSLHQAAGIRQKIADSTLRERLGADHAFVEALVDSSRPTTAGIERLTRSIDFHRQYGRRMLLAQMLLARSRARGDLGDGDGAWTDVEAAIRELEQQRETTPGGDLRAGIFASASEIVEAAVAMQLARGDAAAALHYAERARARVLLDALSRGPIDIPLRDHEWTAHLPSKTVAVSYIALADAIYIFVVDRRGVSAVRTGASLRWLRSEADAFAGAASHDDVIAMHGVGARLHEALILPIANHLRGATEILISGESEVMTIPFGALRDPVANRYLVEDCGVVTTPSIAAYVHLVEVRRRRPLSHRSRLLAIGDPTRRNDMAPLPAARREIDAVAALYRRPVVLTAANATRAAFLEQAVTADVIHFAGHGRRGVRPGEASLVFADGADDGVLYASELSTIPMPEVAVAVLAACDTAQAIRRDSEGVWSMARSFLVAGVPSVVATLWPIDDAGASLFFTRLHEHLLRGLSPAAAVRETQLDFLRKNDGADPSLWAAVQTTGS